MKILKSLYVIALALTAGPSVSLAAPPAKAKAKPVAKPVAVDLGSYLSQARAAIAWLDFDAAESAADNYRSKDGKADVADRLDRQIELGRTMLDRVEKIQVIDSLTVDSAAFFNAYRLSVPSGRLIEGEAVTEVLPDSVRQRLNPASPAYINENSSAIMWTSASSDPADATVMWQSDLLADGTWDAPHRLFSYKSIFDSEDTGRSVYSPYLMSDGMTLYFAADGNASLGGLDIFISRRDDDGFLQPQNIGMPYNSPYNDFMFAIDEVTGVGWWATDRNHVPGKVTIYRFIPSELRVNYSPDTDNLKSLALLKSVAATHPAGADYSSYLDAIDVIGDDDTDDCAEFEFAMPGGKIYRSLDDFKSASARNLMQEYLELAEQMQLDIERLSELREAYRNGDRSVAGEIVPLENSINSRRASLRSKANEVIKVEGAR